MADGFNQMNNNKYMNPYAQQMNSDGTKSSGGSWSSIKPNWGQIASTGITSLGQLSGSSYDQRIGMERPNAFKSMTDFSLANAASAFGPVGTLIGGAADLMKNVFGYQAHVNQYKDGKKMADMRDQLNSQRQMDATGYAKYGTKVKSKYGYGGKSPYMQMGGQAMPNANLENNEIVLTQNGDGSFNKVAQTSPMAPTHEQGGVDMNLPNGAYVFPQQYLEPINNALAMGDNAAIEAMKGQMMQESSQAANMGLPFSNPYMQTFADGGQVQDTSMRTDAQVTNAIPSPYTMDYAAGQSDYALQDNAMRFNPYAATPVPNYERDLQYYDPNTKGYANYQDNEYNTASLSQDATAKNYLNDELSFLEKEIAQGKINAANKDSYVNRLASVQRYSEKNPEFMGRYIAVNDFFQSMANPNSEGSQLAGMNTPQNTTPQSGGNTPQMDASGNPYAPNDNPQGNNQNAATNQYNQQANSVLGADRTQSRVAAKQAGIYWSQDKKAMTYWDSADGKRKFNALGAQVLGVQQGMDIGQYSGQGVNVNTNTSSNANDANASKSNTEDNSYFKKGNSVDGIPTVTMDEKYATANIVGDNIDTSSAPGIMTNPELYALDNQQQSPYMGYKDYLPTGSYPMVNAPNKNSDNPQAPSQKMDASNMGWQDVLHVNAKKFGPLYNVFATGSPSGNTGNANIDKNTNNTAEKLPPITASAKISGTSPNPLLTSKENIGGINVGEYNRKLDEIAANENLGQASADNFRGFANEYLRKNRDKYADLEVGGNKEVVMERILSHAYYEFTGKHADKYYHGTLPEKDYSNAAPQKDLRYGVDKMKDIYGENYYSNPYNVNNL